MDYGMGVLPAREGVYDRDACALESDKRIYQEESGPQKEEDESGDLISVSCRACEFACPVGA